MSSELTNYFNQLIKDVLIIASEKSTTSSKIISIDMFTNVTDNPLSDDVHYNDARANFIATRYYSALEIILDR